MTTLIELKKQLLDAHVLAAYARDTSFNANRAAADADIVAMIACARADAAERDYDAVCTAYIFAERAAKTSPSSRAAAAAQVAYAETYADANRAAADAYDAAVDDAASI